MSDITCGIYMIENIIDNNVYIGSSKDIDGRISSHSRMLENNKHHSFHLQNAFNKYGFDTFEYEVLITCHQDMLLWYEQQFLDAWKPVYNMSGLAGKVEFTDEVIKKQSIKLIGRKCSDEHKRKISIAKTGNKYWKGRSHSDDAKRKISMALQGRLLSEEVKKRISNSLLGNTHTEGHKLSEEHKKKISDAMKGNAYGKGNTHWIGRRHSEESKRKISETKRRMHALRREQLDS